MRQALLIVLDSVGIGDAPDAADYGDEGADTVGHLREAVSAFSIPCLDQAGLVAAEALASGAKMKADTSLSWGCLTEVSAGKDTTTGHWEIAGAIIDEPFATYTAFPESLVLELEAAADCTFIGNYAESGTLILQQLGEAHLETGNPILYTSTDSVIQIAAHEEVIPVDRLYQICRSCRAIADRERIGRVIARPFAGQPGNFLRTPRRHDFSLHPPRTVLNDLSDTGVEIIGVGKISDIFAGSGINRSCPTESNAQGCETIDRLLAESPQTDRLIFANLVDFDMLYGHRRDPAGYASALEQFDRWLDQFLSRNQPFSEDFLFIITADHGNDPTWAGTDHTRERVPLLVGSVPPPRPLGLRDSFADIAASLAEWFGVTDYQGAGTSFM